MINMESNSPEELNLCGETKGTSGSVLQPAPSYSACPGSASGAYRWDVPDFGNGLLGGGVQNDLVNSGHQTSPVFYCPKSRACQALSVNCRTQPWRSWEGKEELFFISCLILSALTPAAAFHCSSLLQLLEVAQLWCWASNQLSCSGEAEGLWTADVYSLTKQRSQVCSCVRWS